MLDEAVLRRPVGGLGAPAGQLLRLVGAAPIVAVDPHAPARERARSLGADAAFDPGDPGLRQLVRAKTNGQGLNVAFDFAGVPAAREQALGLLGRFGRLVLAGIANSPGTIGSDSRFAFLQQAVVGHYGSGVTHVEQLVELAGRRQLDLSRSVSAVFDLADAEQAVKRLQVQTESQIRLVLRP